MSDCLFCKIAAHQAPARIVYQDDLVTVFHDTIPAAPVHLLVIPNRHIISAAHLTDQDETLVGRLFGVIRKVTEDMGIAEAGYRIIINTRTAGGQSIPHLHIHVLGGKRMAFRPTEAL